jgi:hypothetical protein
VEGECELVLLPIATDSHFTNVKPDFMLSLFDEPTLGIDYVFYLDPDICAARDWRFFEDWASCGVALCEDINSPIAEHHPRRVGWRRYFSQHGIELVYRSDAYVNGGCVGVSRRDRVFLENWLRLTSHMAGVIGGLGVAKIDKGKMFTETGFASCFDASDQDALNAAVEMTSNLTYSTLPRSAMGFEPGDLVLPHALGSAKPWRRRYLVDALRGKPPRAADKAFWMYADSPLRHMSKARVHSERGRLAMASALSRFYRRR